MKRKQKKVAVGGTFEIIHRGHIALLKRAFGLGEVFIGLTSDKMAFQIKKRKVKPFKERKKNLEKKIKEIFSRKAKILKIEDEYGTTLKDDFDYLVVSPETEKTAILINERRKLMKKKQIKIVKVNFVLAQDKKPISDRRILRGEIDKEGNLL